LSRDFRTLLTTSNAGRPYVLLEDRLNGLSPATLYIDPIEIVCCRTPDRVAEALAQIEAAVDQGLHAAGFASFDLGYALEERLMPLLPHDRSLPLLWFGLFKKPIEIEPEVLDSTLPLIGPPPPITALEYALDRDAYQEKMTRVLEYIRAGDVYQVNLTFPVRFRYGGHPLALYAALRARQPVAHGGVVSFEGTTIVSVSPELFLRVADGQATTRPMKGTLARGADPEADRAAIDRLIEDPKQRAENLMIVDLMRNDLSRVSAVGSVEVPKLFEVETYPTLHTLTSTVTARLRKDAGPAAIFQAMFPCGSVTGAPKHRAMEIIREIEGPARDVYTGSIGAISPDGTLAFNVAIRTATLNSDGSGCYGAGGGIVADSKPDSEYDECLLKARILTDLAADYELIETFGWSARSGFVRLDMHLDRLTSSAEHLGFQFNRPALEAELAELADMFPRDAVQRRVRLKLNRAGKVEITSEALVDGPRRPLLVGIEPVRVDGADPFLRHKTTCRQRYEACFARAAAAGLDEVIFLNRNGHVTEASRHNVFVEINGRLATPPVTSGLLPGILRQELLQSGAAVERNLTLDDIHQSGRWFVGNSLRGLQTALLKQT